MLPHIFSAESRTFVELHAKVLPIAEEIDILLKSSALLVFSSSRPTAYNLQKSVPLALAKVRDSRGRNQGF